MKKRQKKRWIFLITMIGIFICAIVWFYENTGDRFYERYRIYCSDINKQIKDESFFLAALRGKSIELQDQNRNVYKIVPLKHHRFWYSIKSISQEREGIIFYSLGGAADDSIGIVFVNDPKLNNELDGIDWIIRRSYHKKGDSDEQTYTETELGISGISKWMPDVGYLKRLGPNVYRYSTRWDYEK